MKYCGFRWPFWQNMVYNAKKGAIYYMIRTIYVLNV